MIHWFAVQLVNTEIDKIELNARNDRIVQIITNYNSFTLLAIPLSLDKLVLSISK